MILIRSNRTHKKPLKKGFFSESETGVKSYKLGAWFIDSSLDYKVGRIQTYVCFYIFNCVEVISRTKHEVKQTSFIHKTRLKWLVTKKLIFFVGFPPSALDFFVKLHVPLNVWVSSYLDLKLHNVFPFCIFSMDFWSKRGHIVQF